MRVGQLSDLAVAPGSVEVAEPPGNAGLLDPRLPLNVELGLRVAVAVAYIV